jgi:hypothetical protein
VICFEAGHHDLVFVDGDDMGFVVRARGVAAQLLELTAPANLGATRVGVCEWRVAEQACTAVAAMAAELRAVVLPGAARLLGVPAQTRVEGSLLPESLWDAGPGVVLGCRWEELVAAELTAAECRCDACGRRASHAEAVFDFDDDAAVATARNLVVFCRLCTLVAHHGMARMTDREPEAVAHAEAVNGWSAEETARHWKGDARLWLRRSERDWSLDLSPLT